MCPVLLHFLLVAALSAETAFEWENNTDTGMNFIVVFPENIAYYHPTAPQNMIQVTAMKSNAEVTMRTDNNVYTQIQTLSAGETREFYPPSTLELNRTDISNQVVVISSSRRVVVTATSRRENSVQTALVIPVDRLAKEYLIPPLPQVQGTTDGQTLAVTEKNPFKLVIISADHQTTVTVEGATSTEVELQPHEVAQIWVEKDSGRRAVKASESVAVLFSHACAMRDSCTCALLQSVLPPASEETLKFFVPPVLTTFLPGQPFLLLSDTVSNSSTIQSFDQNSPLLEIAGSALLYQPGLLLPLIPDTEFASCFVVNRIQAQENFAVIVVHRDLTDGVHIGMDPLASPSWQELNGTDHVSTLITLEQDKNIVWHTSSLMAVYFLGKQEQGVFGNPAPIISKTPDFRGCLLSPEVVKIGEEADGWRESVKFCSDRDLQLVSLSSSENVSHIYREVKKIMDDSVTEVWIGMRRSSQTGEWYWLNSDPVSNTNWTDGGLEPKGDGQCAIMRVESGEDFGWRVEDCCKTARPLCYRRPKLFPLS